MHLFNFHKTGANWPRVYNISVLFPSALARGIKSCIVARIDCKRCMYVSHFWNAINLTWRHMCLVKIARKRVNLYLVDSHVFMCLHAVTGWRRRDRWWAYLRAKVILRLKYLALAHRELVAVEVLKWFWVLELGGSRPIKATVGWSLPYLLYWHSQPTILIPSPSICYTEKQALTSINHNQVGQEINSRRFLALVRRQARFLVIIKQWRESSRSAWSSGQAPKIGVIKYWSWVSVQCT